ncbi:JAB domain-containing protein [Pseudomonas sp. MYb398]|uniref:JAB domain-containing protein n=1 Tax=Pseudomonas sp. MYb398 TaxID=2745385 RepID=UPI0030B25318
MSQLSFPSFDSSLLVRDAHGRYLPASADDILEAARQVIDQKMQRGAEFNSPAAVKEYLRTKLAGFEHEVFAVLFMDTRHRLIEYREMFRGTIDGASVYPREVVKEALRLNAAAVVISHNHPSGSPEPSAADRALTQRKLPRQAGTSKVELSACWLRYSTGVIPPSESWDRSSL